MENDDQPLGVGIGKTMENPFLHKPICDISYSIIRLQTKLHWDFACCFSILFDVFPLEFRIIKSESANENPPSPTPPGSVLACPHWAAPVEHWAYCWVHSARLTAKTMWKWGMGPPDFWLKWRRKWWKNNGGEVADLIFWGIPNFLGFPMAEKQFKRRYGKVAGLGNRCWHFSKIWPVQIWSFKKWHSRPRRNSLRTKSFSETQRRSGLDKPAKSCLTILVPSSKSLHWSEQCDWTCRFWSPVQLTFGH